MPAGLLMDSASHRTLTARDRPGENRRALLDEGRWPAL